MARRAAKVRRAIHELTAPARSVAASDADQRVHRAVHRAASFPEALDVALPRCSERAGARFIVLLEKVRMASTEPSDCAIPARGVLINRLTHYPHPLPLTRRRLRGVAALGPRIPSGARRRDRAARRDRRAHGRRAAHQTRASSACCCWALPRAGRVHRRGKAARGAARRKCSHC